MVAALTALPRVSIGTFQRMAARNLTLRGVDIDAMTDDEKVDAIADAYRDEATRLPANRAARRRARKLTDRALTADHHRAWYAAEREWKREQSAS